MRESAPRLDAHDPVPGAFGGRGSSGPSSLRRDLLLRLRLDGPPSTNTNLLLWKPGTVHVNDLRTQRLRAAESIKRGPNQRIAYRVPSRGWYYVEVKLTTPGFGRYTLSITRA